MINFLLAFNFFFVCNDNYNFYNEKLVCENSDSIVLSQQKILHEDFNKKLSKFIPANYSILKLTFGDLNMDRIEDCILVLKKNGEDTTSAVGEGSGNRPLLLLLGDESNQLFLARRNDNTVYCYECGGIFGDPFVDITINDNSFTIEHYGGSVWRWTRSITYKYSKSDNEWYLYSDVSENFHLDNPEKIEIENLTVKNFGIVKFENFNINNRE